MGCYGSGFRVLNRCLVGKPFTFIQSFVGDFPGRDMLACLVLAEAVRQLDANGGKQRAPCHFPLQLFLFFYNIWSHCRLMEWYAFKMNSACSPSLSEIPNANMGMNKILKPDSAGVGKEGKREGTSQHAAPFFPLV